MSVVVDENLVRKLIAAQFPRWNGQAIARWPSGGTVNAMFRLGDDMVVRLPLTAGGAKDVALEQEWLPRIASRLPTAIPEVLGAGRPTEGYPWPWSVYRWLPGENPREGTPVPLAEFVLAMRSLPLTRRAPEAHRGGPLAGSTPRPGRRSSTCARSRRRTSTATPSSPFGRRRCAPRHGKDLRCGCTPI